jgi:hypothetical protein
MIHQGQYNNINEQFELWPLLFLKKGQFNLNT